MLHFFHHFSTLDKLELLVNIHILSQCMSYFQHPSEHTYTGSGQMGQTNFRGSDVDYLCTNMSILY